VTTSAEGDFTKREVRKRLKKFLILTCTVYQPPILRLIPPTFAEILQERLLIEHLIREKGSEKWFLFKAIASRLVFKREMQRTFLVFFDEK
jgi:hypothetical protein